MAKIIWVLPLSEGQKVKEHNFLLCISICSRRKNELDKYMKLCSNDDFSLKGKQDDIRINITQVWERQYWAKKFGITQARLIKIVKTEGPLVKNLIEHLWKNDKNKMAGIQSWYSALKNWRCRKISVPAIVFLHAPFIIIANSLTDWLKDWFTILFRSL